MKPPQLAPPTTSCITFAFYQEATDPSWHIRVELGRFNEQEMETRLHLGAPVQAMVVRHFEYDGTWLPKWILNQFKQKIDRGATGAVEWFLEHIPTPFLESLLDARWSRDGEKKTGTNG